MDTQKDIQKKDKKQPFFYAIIGFYFIVKVLIFSKM